MLCHVYDNRNYMKNISYTHILFFELEIPLPTLSSANVVAFVSRSHVPAQKHQGQERWELLPCFPDWRFRSDVQGQGFKEKKKQGFKKKTIAWISVSICQLLPGTSVSSKSPMVFYTLVWTSILSLRYGGCVCTKQRRQLGLLSPSFFSWTSWCLNPGNASGFCEQHIITNF